MVSNMGSVTISKTQSHENDLERDIENAPLFGFSIDTTHIKVQHIFVSTYMWCIYQKKKERKK